MHLHTQGHGPFEHYIDYNNIKVSAWHQTKLTFWEKHLAKCLKTSRGEGLDTWPKWRMNGTTKGEYKLIMSYYPINVYQFSNGPGGDLPWLKNLRCVKLNLNKLRTPIKQNMEKYWSNTFLGLVGEWNMPRPGSISIPYITV